MPPRRKLAQAAAALLVAAGAAGLGLSARADRDSTRLFEDEREFAGAAANVARHGVLAWTTPGTTPPASGNFREPAYPALVALAWRVAAAPVPASADEVARLPELGRPWRAVRALNLMLLALAVAAAGLAVGRLGGALAGALAFALVAASPALRATSTQLMSENLAAAHLALAALALLALARGERRARWPALAVVALLPLSRAEGVLLLPVALLVDWMAGRSRPAAQRRHATAMAAAVLVLPAALWLARNAVATGHAVLADRGGLALAVRAEVDAQVERCGARAALLAWTPLDAARRASLRLAPEADWLDYRPSGPGNFYQRTLRAWQRARAAPGADPLAVDAAFGRAALARFASSPGAHARAAAAVAVRGVFAERSPEWSSPFDLAFGAGILLAAGMLVATATALRHRDPGALALLAPALILFGFHVAATELLPRYGVPLLPLAWASVALVTVSRRASK